MRVMALGTLAVFRRLMFDFGLLEKVIVASEANLPLSSLHFDREPRFVAFVAFAIFVRRVGYEFRLWRRSARHLRGYRPVQRLAVLIVNNRRSVSGRTVRGNAIKEKAQPFLLLL